MQDVSDLSSECCTRIDLSCQVQMGCIGMLYTDRFILLGADGMYRRLYTDSYTCICQMQVGCFGMLYMDRYILLGCIGMLYTNRCSNHINRYILMIHPKTSSDTSCCIPGISIDVSDHRLQIPISIYALGPISRMWWHSTFRVALALSLPMVG